MREALSRPQLAVPLLGCAVFMLVAGIWLAGILQSSELWMYDRLVAWRAGAGTQDPRIALVLLKEEDIRKYDYPLRDSKLAALLQAIEQDHPRAVGLDLYRDLPEPRDASELGQLNPVLAHNSNIIAIFLFNTDTSGPVISVAPPAILSSSPDRIGFNDFATDNRVVRRGFIFSPREEGSLAWQLALLYLTPEGLAPAMEGSSIRLGKGTLPKFSGNEGGYVRTPAGGYQYLFDFKGPQKFAEYSVDDVLTGKTTGAFKDKIVLIGGDSDSAGDYFITPLKIERNKPGIPGVVIHAQAVNQYLRVALDGDTPTRGVPLAWEILLLLFWCAIASAVGYYCRSAWSFGVVLVLCLVGVSGAALALFLHALWTASAGPALAVVLAAVVVKAYAAQVEARHRSALMRLFSRHVSSDVAKSIWEQRDEFAEGHRPRAQKITATVLFTDLKNYSSISEALPPDELMTWINECLGELAKHVDRNGGIINKYIGDSIMAVFGVPARRTTEAAIREDAVHAVSCALDMKAELKRLNDQWEARGLSRVGLRIGIYTGELMAGTVGHEDRLEYTVVGDSVNTASRLESVDTENAADRDAECRILIGEPTFELVKGSFEVELVGSTRFKGQKRVSPFYRVVETKSKS